MAIKYNFEKVFRVFKNNYKEIPLEIFGKDPYQVLVSTLLSARTRDEVTLKVCKKLFHVAGTIEHLSKLRTGQIEKLIHGVGFYTSKAKYLKDLAGYILTRFGGKVPKTQSELMSLPGVGKKTANLVLNKAFGIPAIAVDTHVHRITNMLGWVNTKDPLKTEAELNKILPKKYWSEVNRIFVSIGRQFNSKRKLEAFLKTNQLI